MLDVCCRIFFSTNFECETIQIGIFHKVRRLGLKLMALCYQFSRQKHESWYGCAWRLDGQKNKPRYGIFDLPQKLFAFVPLFMGNVLLHVFLLKGAINKMGAKGVRPFFSRRGAWGVSTLNKSKWMAFHLEALKINFKLSNALIMLTKELIHVMWI